MKLNLYWVETEDGAEDWFVVAGSDAGAARWHDGAEGYERGDATATFVAHVPQPLATEAGCPSHELLEACGAHILRAETPRVVEIEGRRFVEGYLDLAIDEITDDMFEALGRGRPNGTKRRSVQ